MLYEVLGIVHTTWRFLEEAVNSIATKTNDATGLLQNLVMYVQFCAKYLWYKWNRREGGGSF